MDADEINRIRRAAGLSVAELGATLRLAGNAGDYVRDLERGRKVASGPVEVILELIDSDELPERFYPPDA